MWGNVVVGLSTLSLARRSLTKLRTTRTVRISFCGIFCCVEIVGSRLTLASLDGPVRKVLATRLRNLPCSPIAVVFGHKAGLGVLPNLNSSLESFLFGHHTTNSPNGTTLTPVQLGHSQNRSMVNATPHPVCHRCDASLCGSH